MNHYSNFSRIHNTHCIEVTCYAPVDVKPHPLLVHRDGGPCVSIPPPAPPSQLKPVKIKVRWKTEIQNKSETGFDEDTWTGTENNAKKTSGLDTPARHVASEGSSLDT